MSGGPPPALGSGLSAYKDTVRLVCLLPSITGNPLQVEAVRRLLKPMNSGSIPFRRGFTRSSTACLPGANVLADRRMAAMRATNGDGGPQ